MSQRCRCTHATHIRLATEADLPAINDIYNYYVPRSTCTYQLEPETLDDRRGLVSPSIRPTSTR